MAYDTPWRIRIVDPSWIRPGSVPNPSRIRPKSIPKFFPRPTSTKNWSIWDVTENYLRIGASFAPTEFSLWDGIPSVQCTDISEWCHCHGAHTAVRVVPCLSWLVDLVDCCPHSGTEVKRVNLGSRVGRDRKKLNSGVRVRSFSETLELVKFKLANFFEIKS